MFYVICPHCTSICIPILFTNNVSVRCFIVGYHKNIILYIALFLSSPQIDINFWYIHKILFAAIVLCICFLTNLPNGQFKIHARYIASGHMITYCSRTPPKQIIVYLDIPTDYILLANKVTFSLMIRQSNYAFTINILSFVCYIHICHGKEFITNNSNHYMVVFMRHTRTLLCNTSLESYQYLCNRKYHIHIKTHTEELPYQYRLRVKCFITYTGEITYQQNQLDKCAMLSTFLHMHIHTGDMIMIRYAFCIFRIALFIFYDGG